MDADELPSVEAMGLGFKFTVDESKYRALSESEVAAAPHILRDMNFALPQGSRLLLAGANGTTAALDLWFLKFLA